MLEFVGGETLEKRKLELAFIDKNGRIYPIDEVSRAELAEGLEKISKETAKRLLLVREQR
jgi:ethanolamine utilization cobalamin adenosyltransferase